MPVTHREMNIIPLVLNAKNIFFKMHWLIRLNVYFQDHKWLSQISLRRKVSE